MKTYSDRLSDALVYLNLLIYSGVEYPDAQYRAASKFNVNHDDLQAEYDQQFSQGDRT